MKFENSYRTIIIIIAIVLLALAIVLLFDLFNTSYSCSTKEGLVDTVPIATNPNTSKRAGLLLDGFYQVDDENMAITPYGFKTDPSNQRHILPATKIGYNMLVPRYHPPLPAPGQPLPEKFYLKNVTANGVSDLSLAILPPDMMPNVNELDFSGNPPTLLIYYNPGYISETQYYKNKYVPRTKPDVLPKELYYTDESKTKVAFLQYGEIQDKDKGYGKMMNPTLDLKMKDFNYKTSNYRDVSNNYDMQFHDDEDTIKKQNNLYDLNFGEVRVRDQNGNIIILPKVESQNAVTYHQPGEFVFGSSKYIPNYEDSIYLSQISRNMMFGNTKAGECDTACKAYNEFKSKMDKIYS